MENENTQEARYYNGQPIPDGINTSQVSAPKLLPFGNKWIHGPNLLNCTLQLRSFRGYTAKNFPTRHISVDMKNLISGVVIDKVFDQTLYDSLPEVEQKLFDDACKYVGYNQHLFGGGQSHSQKEKTELISKYELLRDEFNAGNRGNIVLKQMRQILLELQTKGYVRGKQLELLLMNIVACIE